MQMACEVCQAPLRPEDVRLDIAVAKCHSCNAVYDLAGRKGRGLTVTAPDKPKLARAKAPMPSRFRVDDDGERARISWRWFKTSHLVMLFFSIGWDSFFVFLYYSVLSEADISLAVIFFSLGHVAVGLALTYASLGNLMNRTTVEVSRDHLRIRHGPLPWVGNLDAVGRKYTQLYGVEKTSGGEDNKTLVYDLKAMERSGKTVTLITELSHRDQVVYLEQTLERCLGIEDAPIEGEVATRINTA